MEFLTLYYLIHEVDRNVNEAKKKNSYPIGGGMRSGKKP